MMMFASGVASADALASKTYDDAVAAISSWKGKPVIGTVSGDLLETGGCIVDSSHKSIFLDPSGDTTRSSEIVLNLNCNNHLASPGDPGNSLTLAGAKAKKDQIAAANINRGDPSWCEKSGDRMQLQPSLQTLGSL